MLSHIGGTVAAGGAADVMTFQSYVDPANGQNFTGAGTLTTGPQSPSITGTGSYSNDHTLVITSLGTPYSITERFSITMSPGAEVNFSSSTTLSSVVPEPSTMAIAGLGAIGFLGYGLRRRLKK
jgi:hypothetical protein